MNIFVEVREAWEDSPKLFIQTVVSSVVLGLLAPVAVAIAFVL